MIISNPKLFRELSEPFESQEVASDALEAFWKELAELRKKHKVPNLLVVAGASWVDGEEEAESIALSTFGDQMRQEQLAAYALGKIQSERQEMIGKLLSSAIKKGRRES